MLPNQTEATNEDGLSSTCQLTELSPTPERGGNNEELATLHLMAGRKIPFNDLNLIRLESDFK